MRLATSITVLFLVGAEKKRKSIKMTKTIAATVTNQRTQVIDNDPGSPVSKNVHTWANRNLKGTGSVM